MLVGLSYSSMRRMELCPGSYALARERKRDPLPPEIVLKGNVLHRFFEERLTNPRPFERRDALLFSQGEFTRLVDKDKPRWSVEDIGVHLSDVLSWTDRVNDFADQLLGWARSVDGRVKPEMSVKVFLPGGWLEGYVDVAIFVPEQGWAVFDLKTGSGDPDQLVFYDRLLERWSGFPVIRSGFYFPSGVGMKAVTISDDDRAGMDERMRKAWVAVAQDQFPFTGFPGECARCPSRNHCPKQIPAASGKLA